MNLPWVAKHRYSIGFIAIPFQSTVSYVVLNTDVYLGMFQVISLRTFRCNGPRPFYRMQVFSVNFRTATPTKVARSVSVQHPGNRTFMTIVFFVFLVLVMFNTDFITRRHGYFMRYIIIRDDHRHSDL